MPDWEHLKHFLAVVRTGSLSGAARRLGVNQTTVGRRIDALEAELKARLFERTPAGFVPTEAARTILPAVESIADQTAHVERAVGGREERLEGEVSIAATEVVAQTLLVPALAVLREREPGISPVVITSNRQADLLKGDADLAIRLVQPEHQSLVARRLSEFRLAPYASLSYLARAGVPRPGFAGHDVVTTAGELEGGVETRWFAAHARGGRVAFRANSVRSLLAACTAGFGVAILGHVVAEGVPELRRLDGLPPVESRPTWLVATRRRLQSPRIRAVYDFLGTLKAG